VLGGDVVTVVLFAWTVAALAMAAAAPGRRAASSTRPTRR
jgi:hypothetical protein